MLLSDYQNQVQQLVHDSSGIDYQTSDLNLYINEARNRVAEDFWCVRTYFANLTAIVGQESYPMNGGVGGGKVIAGGSWAVAPQISFSLPPGNVPGGGGFAGVRASGTPVMAGTAPNLTIVGVAMTNWGSGYVAAPSLSIVGGSGTPNPANPVTNVTAIAGAPSGLINVTVASTAGFNSGDWVSIAGVTGTTEANGTWQIDVTASLSLIQLRLSKFSNAYIAGGTVTDGIAVLQAIPLLNVIDIYTISYMYPPGVTGQRRAMLEWAPFSTFNAILRYNTINTGAPGCWSQLMDSNTNNFVGQVGPAPVVTGGTFFLYPASPDQNYVLEIDAFTLPNPLVNNTDVELQIPIICQELVQYQAAYKALLKAQNFDQADYYDKKYDKRALEKNLRRTAPRRPNIYQNVWRRVQRGYF